MCAVHMEQVVFLLVEISQFRFVFRPGFHLGAPTKHKVMTKSILYKIYWEILFQKVALGYLLHFVQNGSSKTHKQQICLHNNLKHLTLTRPGFHLGAPKKRKVVTTPILCKISRGILFQKVALGYLLHFAQNGSSNNILNKYMLYIDLKNPKVTRPGFHLGAPKKRKVATKTIYIKDTGKSSSRKLRRVIYYTLYRMDPQKTGYLLHFVQDES